MTYKLFNRIKHEEKLLLIHHNAKKLDDIFPWFGNLRIIHIYKLYDFLIELEFDLTTNKISNVIAFKAIDYLEKYPHHFENIKYEISKILKE